MVKNLLNWKYISFIEFKDLNIWFRCEGNQINNEQDTNNQNANENTDEVRIITIIYIFFI